MAGDVVSLMRHLGHEQFAVVGHDRGSLVAFRTAMDHPRAVTRLVVMDGLPIVEHLERLNEVFVRTWWHWWFYGQTEKPAERVINLDPDAWYRTPSPQEMGEGNHADVWAALCDPAVVHGMCEDYRAGLRIDRAHEEADRTAGRQIACPMLLLAAGSSLLAKQDPAAGRPHPTLSGRTLVHAARRERRVPRRALPSSPHGISSPPRPTRSARTASL